jgi:hypothetical protein
VPNIIVQAHATGSTPGTATLIERAVPVDLHDEHYIAQLIERLVWALIDAERLENATTFGDRLRHLPREVAEAHPPNPDAVMRADTLRTSQQAELR